MKKNLILRWSNLLIFIGIIIVNAAANIVPINGKTTGEVSAAYDNYFTPSGPTFAIWSLIYLSFLVFSIYQFFQSKRDRDNQLTENIGTLFIWNGLANMGWIFAWHYQVFELTLVFMLVLLITLIRINMRIINNSWWAKFPFQLYLGWICVATIANTAVYLKYLGWDGEAVFGMIMVGIAGILALFLVIEKYWIWASIALAWGIYGIHNKQAFLYPSGSAYQTEALIVAGIILVISIFIPLNKILKKSITT